ncbi:MAG: ABC transporter permease [Bacillota bacterium]
MTFLNIFRSEVKYQLKSIVFWIFIMVTIFFVMTQFGFYSGSEVLAPQPGQSYYGRSSEVTEESELQGIYLYLTRDISRGQTLKYGFMINKDEKIRPEAKEAMLELQSRIQDGDISYQEFNKMANQVDELLGGNTIYNEENRKRYLSRELNYEEAKAIFDRKVNEAGLTNAYGRLFADYLGISAGFFPVFLAAFLLLKDRKNKMIELVQVRKVRPFTYITAKFTAITALVFLFYLLLSLQPTYAFYRIAAANAWDFHFFGFIKYVVYWILPTLMFTIAIGMTIAEIANRGVVAILVQIFIWFNSISVLSGDYSLSKHIIRFNSSSSYDLYLKSISAIRTNRIFYIVLSILILFICSWIWKKKEVLS